MSVYLVKDIKSEKTKNIALEKEREKNNFINNVTKQPKKRNIISSGNKIKFLANKYYHIFLIMAIIMYLSTNILSSKINSRNLINNSEITIIINASGKKKILNNDGNYKPSSVFINNISFELTSDNEYTLPNNNENIITISWNYKITDCYRMFYYISNIISIDFSKFDASSVTGMSEMFKGCNDLQSIIFNGINTSSVTTMYKMFTSCSSLKYLDLSDFDTSKTKDMTSMFEECYELISLDLSSFNMSLVTTISLCNHFSLYFCRRKKF